ncbi:MAG TPA: magnesium/cobalt transporter CorA [Nitrospiria bacterium]|nr:magnesium/cobalt transporter CorA [Nitrospiria bacterium]
MIQIFAFSKQNGLRRIPEAESLPGLLKDDAESVWVDLESPTEEETLILSSVFNFHPLAIEDCVAESHLPKLDDFGDYLFLVLHGARSGDVPGTFKAVELNFFLGKRFLVTYHQQLSRSIIRTKERCLKNSLTMSRGMDFLLYEILDSAVDNYFPILDDFDEVLDELEREVTASPGKETLNRIFTLKRDGMSLRRVTSPQREILNRLSRDPFSVVNKRTAIYFRDVYDHLVRINDLAESYKDLTTGLLEAYISMVSNRLNEIVKVLTALTVVFMPLTVITGIYGMNFKNMPELEWRYGYPATIGTMVGIVVMMLWFFRRKKWI